MNTKMEKLLALLLISGVSVIMSARNVLASISGNGSPITKDVNASIDKGKGLPKPTCL